MPATGPIGHPARPKKLAQQAPAGVAARVGGAPGGGKQWAMVHLLQCDCCVHIQRPPKMSPFLHRSTFTNGSSGGSSLTWAAPPKPKKPAGLQLTVSSAPGCGTGNDRPLLQADPLVSGQTFFYMVRLMGGIKQERHACTCVGSRGCRHPSLRQCGL